MSTLGTVGRYLYALPFAVFGLLHFMNGPAMAGMVPVPGGVLWVYITGAAFIAAAAAIMIGKMASLAAALLGVLLLSFVLTIHVPGVMGAADQAAMQTSMTNLLKDAALAGGAWFIAGVMAVREKATARPAPAEERAAV